jgi:hypothetical protein
MFQPQVKGRDAVGIALDNALHTRVRRSKLLDLRLTRHAVVNGDNGLVMLSKPGEHALAVLGELSESRVGAAELISRRGGLCVDC